MPFWVPLHTSMAKKKGEKGEKRESFEDSLSLFLFLDPRLSAAHLSDLLTLSVWRSWGKIVRKLQKGDGDPFWECECEYPFCVYEKCQLRKEIIIVLQYNIIEISNTKAEIPCRYRIQQECFLFSFGISFVYRFPRLPGDFTMGQNQVVLRHQ